MLALISYEPAADRHRRLRRRSGLRPDAVEKCRVLGLNCLKISVRDIREAQIVSKEAMTYGVDCAALRGDFPYTDVFSHIRKPDESAILRSLFSRVVLDNCAKDASVYISGASMDIGLIRLLSENNRYVIGDIPDALRKRLMQDLGITIIRRANAALAVNTKLAVLRAATPAHICLPRECVTVAFNPEYYAGVTGGRRVTGIIAEAAGDIPPGFSRDGLIAEALLRGALSPDDIKITKILTKGMGEF